MNANWIKELLSEKFSEFLGSINAVYEDNHLIESEGIQQVSKFLEFLILRENRSTSLI